MARLALLSALSVLALGDAAAAFNCAKARSPIETAICADPATKTSDEAMVAAFEQVRSAAAPAQRQSILDDQRAWLKERNTNCQTEKVAACISDANKRRVAVLLAQPESGPGIDPPPAPFFVRQAGNKTKVDVAVQLYRFAEPRSDGERALNAAADKAVAAITWKKDEPDDRDWSHEVTWAIGYASPAFLSIRTSGYDYSGGAHGSSATGGLNIDMKSGRVLTFAELFDARANAEIGKVCLQQIKAEKKERGAGADDQTELPKQIDEVMKDLSNWSFTESKATVHFDQYALGSYAEGTYECEVPMKQMVTLSKSTILPR